MVADLKPRKKHFVLGKVVQYQHQHRNHHYKRFPTIVRKNPTPNLDHIDQKKFKPFYYFKI